MKETLRWIGSLAGLALWIGFCWLVGASMGRAGW